jgi:hypothetical protein
MARRPAIITQAEVARAIRAAKQATSPSALPPVDRLEPDTPLRLKVAAALAYPDGSMTASGLRKEAGKGRLVIERTAGKDYTTLAAIADMRRLCQQNPKDRASGSAKRGVTNAVEQPIRPSGSSSTERFKRARAAAEMTVSALNGGSKPTSIASTPSRRKKAHVIPIKSLSPTR